jgi:hypothetical protein
MGLFRRWLVLSVVWKPDVAGDFDMYRDVPGVARLPGANWGAGVRLLVGGGAGLPKAMQTRSQNRRRSYRSSCRRWQR